MRYIPVCLNVRGKRIVMIGGGAVALHKLKTITRFARRVTVIAPMVLPGIKKLSVHVIKKPYEASLLKKAFLVYACTDDRAVNARIGRDARALGILVNVADDKKSCDFISPAVYKEGRMVVSVSSQGRDVKGAVALRDRIARYCNEHKDIRDRSSV